MNIDDVTFFKDMQNQLDILNPNPDENKCRGNFDMVKKICNQFGLDTEKAITEIENNGCFCDCEVQFNL